MNAIKEYAYAKVNLHLDVVGKREDGFHAIRSVMHTVSLADEVTVSVREAKETSVFLTVSPKVVPTDGRNLCVSAAKAFLELAGLSREVRINLVKRIPVAGGLAGGSSDAAAVLRALNRLLKKPLGERALFSLAEKLGSDVPYCLTGKTALCEGRGEILTRLSCPKKYHFVVASAGERVSTPAAYGELDRIYSDFTEKKEDGTPLDAELICALSEGQELPPLYNVFEEAVLPVCPKSEGLKKALSEYGATHTLMSGSGPTVFGIFHDESTALSCAEAIKKQGYAAFAVHSV